MGDELENTARPASVADLKLLLKALDVHGVELVNCYNFNICLRTFHAGQRPISCC
ncbi:MAG: hypothetical protein IPH35_25415 [Rhodoferax sp.]|nr:hypothetical protein [Rhodoferax sp.]